ncbi:hypothetical protein ANN_14310 [Periplaneta americana]|uniref:Uncharacterized protein n=1 Tax=Periplaneta americana TaxID=6978 RepID=A0ABQ8SWJ7_PERAM|nr:hypothetical protein ANN_14310 [Periplaneta americana]
MAGLCKGGNDPPGSLKAITREGPRPTSWLLASRSHAEAEVDDHPTRMEVSCGCTMIPPAVIAGIRNRISLPIVAPQVHHDAGVSVCVSVRVSVVSGMSDNDEDEEGRRGNPVPARSLLLSSSTKGAARLNVPIRWTNHYQQ